MKLYLVRHGQIESNVKRIFPEDSEKLSEEGRRQAAFLAGRFASIKIDHIFASPIQRAYETAQEIANAKKLPIEKTNLLVEKFWGKNFISKPYNDPDLAPTRKLLFEKELSDPQYRLADEERFIDIRERARQFVKMAEEKSKDTESLLAVTHGHFLAVLISLLVHGPEVSAGLFRDFYNHLSMSNTGITVAELHEGKWNLVTINDHAHLGDYHRQVH